jgi:dTDP-4-dehydrorhamnose reductase
MEAGMKILVIGASGQLGYDVVKQLEALGHTVIGTNSKDMDITKEETVNKYITDSCVDAVIHCAAYTAVDAAEDNEEICRRVNSKGTEYIAKICGKLNIRLLYISTDYVFSGDGDKPWKTDDIRMPVNFYGQSKYEGELAVEHFAQKYYIVRTSWAFGINGNNFINTMLELAKKGSRVTVVNDQIGSPTYTKDLAVLLAEMIVSDRYGIYHVTNEGICSWFEFACEIFRQAGRKMQVVPVKSEAYPSRARRPLNSRMDNSKLEENGFHRLPAWQDALGRYLKEISEVQ